MQESNNNYIKHVDTLKIVVAFCLNVPHVTLIDYQPALWINFNQLLSNQ
jgi:hypothetical protein